MAESTQQRISTYSISDAGPCLKRLQIEVPADVVNDRLNESFDALLMEAQLPGFRKGRAPKSLLRKRFGESVRSETKNQLVSTAYSESIEDAGLTVLGEPTSPTLSSVELVEGQPLKFEMSVEVMPDIESPDLSDLKLKKPIHEVTDEQIDDEIEKLCLAEGELVEREVAEAGDYISGHGVMKTGDTVIHDIEGAVVQIPTGEEGMILGVLVPDFKKQVGSPKAGDTVTVKTKGPEHHEVEAVRDADLDITFEVERVDRIVPAKMDDVLKQLGMDSVDQIKDALRSRLEQRAAVEQQSLLRQQVASHLLKTIDIDLPQRLTASQTARMLERKRAELLYRGVNPVDIEQNIAKLRAASAAEAQQETKLFFILQKIANDRGVQIQQAEVDGAIAQMAARRGERPEALRQQLVQSKQIGTIVQQILEHKALDAIIEDAEVEEVTKEQWEAFVAEQNES